MLCGLGIILRLIFITLHFQARILSKGIDSGFLVCATPPTVFADPFETYGYFCHGLNMCIWFGYYPQINFCYFVRILNLVIFEVRILSNCFGPIFLKLCRCICHGLKMCMWFGYYPQIDFYYFFRSLNLVIFQARILSKGIDSEYLVCATPPTVLCEFF